MNKKIKFCNVVGCINKTHGAGLCKKHYMRLYRHGNTNLMPKLIGNKNPNYKHGLTRKGSVVPEYKVWSGMIQRCSNPNNSAYSYYGGRGISVCKRWKSFENFYSDMCPRPFNLTLERINNDLGYSPDNCKWATKKEQSKNKRFWGTCQEMNKLRRQM